MEKLFSFPDDGHDSCYQIEDNSFWFKLRNQLITRMVSIYFRPGIFLDVGGGNGFVTKALQDLTHDLKVILLEPGSQGCTNAKKREVRFVINDSLENFNDYSQVENIGLFDVIEHIEQADKFLALVHRRLQDGGRLFITVPAYSSLWSHEDVLAGHFRRYSMRRIVNLLEKNGFEIDYKTYFFATLVPLIFFLRRLPFLVFKKNSEIPKTSHGSGVTSLLIHSILKIELQIMSLCNFRFFAGASIMVVASKRPEQRTRDQEISI